MQTEIFFRLDHSGLLGNRLLKETLNFDPAKYGYLVAVESDEKGMTRATKSRTSL